MQFSIKVGNYFSNGGSFHFCLWMSKVTDDSAETVLNKKIACWFLQHGSRCWWRSSPREWRSEVLGGFKSIFISCYSTSALMMNSIDVIESGKQSCPPQLQVPMSRESFARFTKISFDAIANSCARWLRRNSALTTLLVRWQSSAKTAWEEKARKPLSWTRIFWNPRFVEWKVEQLVMAVRFYINFSRLVELSERINWNN